MNDRLGISIWKAVNNMDVEVKHNLRLIIHSLFRIMNQNRKAAIRKDNKSI